MAQQARNTEQSGHVSASGTGTLALGSETIGSLGTMPLMGQFVYFYAAAAPDSPGQFPLPQLAIISADYRGQQIKTGSTSYTSDESLKMALVRLHVFTNLGLTVYNYVPFGDGGGKSNSWQWLKQPMDLTQFGRGPRVWMETSGMSEAPIPTPADITTTPNTTTAPAVYTGKSHGV